MTNVAVIGAQWGDEGKGKIVDWLSEKADLVVRFQGGIMLVIRWLSMAPNTSSACCPRGLSAPANFR